MVMFTCLTKLFFLHSEEPFLRKPPRKPAPPPPPERPYSVAVTAAIMPNQQAQQFQTWPRQAAPPQMESSNDATQAVDKQKTLPGEKPALPERHLSHHGTSDRPKVPPPVVPPGHHRSASTGAPVTVPGNSLHHTEYDPGSGSPYLQVESHLESRFNNQLMPQPDKSISLNRHTISRPPRPSPPPPPPRPESPPVEETHL